MILNKFVSSGVGFKWNIRGISGFIQFRTKDIIFPIACQEDSISTMPLLITTSVFPGSYMP